MSLGIQLKILFVKRRMSQREAAENVEMSGTNMSLLIQDRYILRDKEIERISNFFNLDKDALSKGKVKELKNANA